MTACMAEGPADQFPARIRARIFPVCGWAPLWFQAATKRPSRPATTGRTESPAAVVSPGGHAGGRVPAGPTRDRRSPARSRPPPAIGPDHHETAVRKRGEVPLQRPGAGSVDHASLLTAVSWWSGPIAGGGTERAGDLLSRVWAGRHSAPPA